MDMTWVIGIAVMGINMEIKPCPNPECCSTRIVTDIPFYGSNSFYVECEDCGLGSAVCDTEEKAINFWNRIVIKPEPIDMSPEDIRDGATHWIDVNTGERWEAKNGKWEKVFGNFEPHKG